MYKNVSGQKLTVYVFDSTTNLPKTGDAANLTAYVNKDDAGVNVLTDTSATEIDSTNAKGFYSFDLAQAETNADKDHFTCKSSTANMVCLAMPTVVYTVPANFTLTSIDGSGRVDVIKIAGTTQTARDLGTSVLLSSGTGIGQILLSSGKVVVPDTQKVDVDTIKTNAVVNGGTITFPTNATVASTTNITGGTITTTTNLTNAPTAGDFTATMKTSLNAATPAVTVSDKTGFALTAAYDAAKTASQAGDAMALTSNERNSTADAFLARNIFGGSSSGRTVKQALAAQRCKVEISGGTMTVYEPDDTTPSWDAAITTTAGDPISRIDPS